MGQAVGIEAALVGIGQAGVVTWRRLTSAALVVVAVEQEVECQACQQR